MMIENGLINIMEKAQTAAAVTPEDYTGADGLIYCGKCHTPKQVALQNPITGKPAKFYCLCRCGVEKRDREAAEREQDERLKRLERRRKDGFPESDMMKCTFENDDMENARLTNALKKYVENFRQLKAAGKGLLLYGPVGTGKTYAACEVANALIDEGVPVLVTNFARITNTLQGMFEGKQDYIDSMNRYELLVIDDLGAERKSEFMQEMVYNIIDSRYRSGLPMIVTTNLAIEEIKDSHDIGNMRIYDRVLERCHPIEVSGGSRRRKAIRESYNDMQALLGL